MPTEPRTITLGDILKKVENGEVVIPEFQRDFVWTVEQVRELLVSVIAGYYIGTIVLIERVSTDECPFKVRPIKGVNRISKVVDIVLDGQQRLTSLYYAKNEPDYPLRGCKSPYTFFVDLEKVKARGWSESVIAMSKRNIRENKLLERPTIIKFSALFRTPAELFKYVKSKTDNDDYANVALDLASRIKESYKISIHSIDKDEPLEVIIEIFERINRQGTPLTVFDLLVARLFKYDINLRELFKEASEKYNFLKSKARREKFGDYIIKTMLLIRGDPPSRKYMLSIDPANFEKDWGRACEALELAYRRTCNTRDGYGVLDFDKWTPYETMIVPMAAMIRFLKDNKVDDVKNYRKLDIWYWVSVFGNRYEHSTDTISKQDYDSMKRWFLDDSAIPDFVRDFNPGSIDLYVESGRRSAIFRGVISLLVLKGARDFVTGRSPEYEKEKIQLDHIFPKSKFKHLAGIDSILNITIISSNQRKLDKRPSEFFGDLLKKHKEELPSILESHLIPKEALENLLNDDFKGFIEKRRSAIISEISNRSKVRFGLK